VIDYYCVKLEDISILATISIAVLLPRFTFYDYAV
jgi:hypothetical protein